MADLLGASIGVGEPLMEAGLDSIGASLLASNSGQKTYCGGEYICKHGLPAILLAARYYLCESNEEEAFRFLRLSYHNMAQVHRR